MGIGLTVAALNKTKEVSITRISDCPSIPLSFSLASLYSGCSIEHLGVEKSSIVQHINFQNMREPIEIKEMSTKKWKLGNRIL